MLLHLKIELNHGMSYKRENLNLEDTARKTLPKEVLEGPDGSNVDAPAATGREMQVQAGLRGFRCEATSAFRTFDRPSDMTVTLVRLAPIAPRSSSSIFIITWSVRQFVLLTLNKHFF